MDYNTQWDEIYVSTSLSEKRFTKCPHWENYDGIPKDVAETSLYWNCLLRATRLAFGNCQIWLTQTINITTGNPTVISKFLT